MSFISIEEILSEKLQKEGYDGVYKYNKQWNNYDVYEPYLIDSSSNGVNTEKFFILVDKNNFDRRTTLEEYKAIAQSKFYLLQLNKDIFIKTFSLQITNLFTAKQEYIYNHSTKNIYNLLYKKHLYNKQQDDDSVTCNKNVYINDDNFERNFIEIIKTWKYTMYDTHDKNIYKANWHLKIVFSNEEVIQISGFGETPEQYNQLLQFLNDSLKNI